MSIDTDTVNVCKQMWTLPLSLSPSPSLSLSLSLYFSLSTQYTLIIGLSDAFKVQLLSI